MKQVYSWSFSKIEMDTTINYCISTSINVVDIKQFRIATGTITSSKSNQLIHIRELQRSAFIYCINCLISDMMVALHRDLALTDALEILWLYFLDFKKNRPSKAQYLHLFLKSSSIFGDCDLKKEVNLAFAPLNIYLYQLIPEKGQHQGLFVLDILLSTASQLKHNYISNSIEADFYKISFETFCLPRFKSYISLPLFT